jgi:MoaA/NifB/PqqE/SkfB family radical SAM enzyme
MIRKKLSPKGLILHDTEQFVTLRLSKAETISLFPKVGLPEDVISPEVVHLEVSSRCNLNCNGCYVRKDGIELTTAEWKGIIDSLTEECASVFQVTFGGGEPLMRDDIFELASYASSRGVNRTMTTNGILLPRIAGVRLRLFDMISISFHEDPDFEPMETLANGLAWLAEVGIKRGINFIVKTSNLQYLSEIVDLSIKYDAELLLLSYKTCLEPLEVVEPEKLKQIALNLSKETRMGIEGALTRPKIAVDGATQGECLCNFRFADIDSKGNLFPCSFIREPMGNLLETPFAEIWKNRERKRTCPYFPLNNWKCWSQLPTTKVGGLMSDKEVASLRKQNENLRD